MSDLSAFLPRIAITIGDPAGIGAEVVLKSVAEESVRQSCVPVIIADARFLQAAARELNLRCDYRIVRRGEEIKSEQNKPIIYDLGNIQEPIEFGVESAASGRAAADFIEAAVELCLKKDVEALSTAPISKRALSLAEVDFPGHTEFLAQLTNTGEFAMSFFARSLRVVLLSTHVSLKRALEMVTRENIARIIRLTDREMRRLGFENPRIAVAGVNPHAGESRMFGDEEAEQINPAIEECRSEGINASGAFSADTIFWRAGRGDFDAVVACYHDQATIAVKSFAFGDSVNVTLGLPFIRTSVDHGTAFEIAGKNLAEHSSMNAAIKLAAELSRQIS